MLLAYIHNPSEIRTLCSKKFSPQNQTWRGVAVKAWPRSCRALSDRISKWPTRKSSGPCSEAPSGSPSYIYPTSAVHLWSFQQHVPSRQCGVNLRALQFSLVRCKASVNGGSILSILFVRPHREKSAEWKRHRDPSSLYRTQRGQPLYAQDAT